MSFLSDNHDRLKLATKASNAGIIDLNIRTGELYISPEFKRLFGYRTTQLRTRSALHKQINPSDLKKILLTDQQVTDTQQSDYRICFRIRNGRGQWRWAIAQCIHQFCPNGKSQRIVRSVTDATHQIQTEEVHRTYLQAGLILQQAQTDEELYTLFFETLNQIFKCDTFLVAEAPESDMPLELLHFSTTDGQTDSGQQRLERYRSLLHNLENPQHLFRDEQEKKHLPGTSSELWIAVPRHSDAKRSAVLILEYFHTDFSFDAVHIEMFRFIFEHISLGRQKILSNQQRTYEASHDPLTGLINRQALLNELALISKDLSKPDRSAALLLIDLNRFKPVNDCYGHIIGDNLLICIADRMREASDGTDTKICRWTGDEFVMVLNNITAKTAYLIAENIRYAISIPYSINKRSIFISASIGVLHIDEPFNDAFHLIRCADLAMHHAKKNGGPEGMTFAYSELSQEKLFDFLWLENDLHQAINNDEFILKYQPLTDPSNGRVKGLEALIRWVHPKHGEIPPDRFIPVAEETGIIADLGIYVLQQACIDAVELLEQFPDLANHGFVSVNVSPRQLFLPNFANEVNEILEISECPSQLLNLEITESLLMENPTEAIRMIHQLKKLGVGITIDDFGTGYASLAYLVEMPVDALKIDRQFINDMDKDPRNKIIVRSIINLANELKLKVTAEGIETQEQMDAVKEMGCDLVQGYFISRPLELALAMQFIQNQLSTIVAPLMV